MIDKHSPLSFKVMCTACYGTEIWTLGRITRLLTDLGKLPPEFKSDTEFIAKQFIAHRGRIHCAGCNKVGVLNVQRIVPET